MKLLIVISIEEYQQTVARLVDQAGIEVFSVSETTGFKDHNVRNLLDNWFSSGSDQFNSMFLFSFTDEAKAEHALELVKKYNSDHEMKFPIRAFILPVDKSSYTT